MMPKSLSAVEQGDVNWRCVVTGCEEQAAKRGVTSRLTRLAADMTAALHHCKWVQ